MMSAHRISQAIRCWSYLGAMPVVAALAVAACGGKVVVDGEGSGGSGGTGTTQSSAAVNPSTGSLTQNVCEAAVNHLYECVPMTDPPPPIPVCEGMILCQFSCILTASCGAFTGIDSAASKVFTDCVIACG